MFSVSGIIKWISIATIYSNTMWWPMSSGWGGLAYTFGKSSIKKLLLWYKLGSLVLPEQVLVELNSCRVSNSERLVGKRWHFLCARYSFEKAYPTLQELSQSHSFLMRLKTKRSQCNSALLKTISWLGIPWLRFFDVKRQFAMFMYYDTFVFLVTTFIRLKTSSFYFHSPSQPYRSCASMGTLLSSKSRSLKFWTFSSFSVFLTFSSMTTFHFFCAMCEGPGYLPLKWRPVSGCPVSIL